MIYEDHRDMVLLGFSYGGMVVTGALRHIGDRVRHLVYLDAFVPRDGDSLLDLAGGQTDGAIRVGDQWLVPPTERRFDDPSEAEFMSARRTPHPIRCFTERVHLDRPLEDHSFERTYIRATADLPDAPGTTAFDAAADHARRSAAWNYREIATNHMVASNRADELTGMLLSIA